MTAVDLSQLRLGDVVRLRKPHACGGALWSVVRLGADIGLRCERCRRRVLLERGVLERRIAEIAQQGEGPTAAEILELIDRGR